MTTEDRKLWGGRFRKKTAPELERISRSLDFDRRLASEEIRINRVYARALERAGWLTRTEREHIEHGLDAVAERISRDPEALTSGDEDIHTAIERLLAEAVGEVAGKLPAGRSRNDLAVTEFRLFLAAAIEEVISEVLALQRALLEKAEASRDTLLPGYTHMRRGQPVVFAQYLLAYFWALGRDRDRLSEARERCRALALGAGAIAGNPFGVDREAMAGELGLSSILENSIDAVSSRDFAVEFLAAAALLGVQLSRMAEDLIVWSTDEFGFVEIDEAYATGSSLMPQKRNPDGLELVRGKCGRLVGDLVGLLAVVKGLPTGYQRDLQEDKEPVWDALDTLGLVLPVLRGTLISMEIRPAAMSRALSPDLLATDLADYLVGKGLVFRRAHRIAGEILAHAAESGRDPSDLDLATLSRFSKAFEKDVASVWDYRASVERKKSRGGVGPEALAEQIRRARESLATT